MLDVCGSPTAPASARRGEHGTFPIVAWSHDGSLTWGTEAIMLSAGTNVEWLRDDLGIIATSADSHDVADAVEDADGVIYVPALLGLGTPHWDYGARGTLVGLTRGTTRAHLVRAVLEGVAHRGADLVDAAVADSGLAIDTVRVDGGMSANPTFTQALADATGRPVEVSPVVEATTLGAGFLAGLATGTWGDMADADRSWTPGPGRRAGRRRWTARPGHGPSSGPPVGSRSCRRSTSRMAPSRPLGRGRCGRATPVELLDRAPAGKAGRERRFDPRPDRSKGRPRVENPTRRRVLAAGITGTALGLFGGRAVSAGTTPPSGSEPTTDDTATDGAAPLTELVEQPTAEDIVLLGFAQSVELAAQALYQISLDAGVEDDVITLMRNNHQSYAQVIAGILGVDAPGVPDDAIIEDRGDAFADTDVRSLSATAYDLESTLVATHTDLVGLLEGINGSHLIASIVTVEAQACAVFADMAGQGTDFDALFVNEARPLPVTESSGG